MKIVVVYNNQAGGAYDKIALGKMVDSAGITIIEWVPLGQKLKSQLKPHIEAGRVIAVVGGDGSQRAVASLLVNTKATMAPLPGGTLNHFTKDLNVPQEMGTAIVALTKKSSTLIDTATVNNEVFVNNSSIGLYPHSLLEREKSERFVGKWPAAIRGAVHSFARFRRYRLEVNGQNIRTAFLFVGNNHYQFESTTLAERKSLTGECLTLFILRSKSRVGMVKVALLDRFNHKQRSDEFIIEQPNDVTIKCSKPQLIVSLDGEIMNFKPPLHYQVAPKSLRVLV